MTAALVALHLAVAVISKTSTPLIFDAQGAWVLFSEATHDVKPIALPSGLTHVQVTLTIDGHYLVYTGESTALHTGGVFVAPIAHPQDVKRLTTTPGNYSQPAASPDGKWIYFTFVHQGDGTPHHHEAMRYAELGRVPLAGGATEIVTSHPGCHGSPQVGPGEAIYYLHDACVVPRRTLEMTHNEKKGVAILLNDDSANEPALSLDGRRLAFLRTVGRREHLTILDLKSKAIVADAVLPLMPHPQPRWGHRGDKVYFMGRGHIWAFNLDHDVSAVADIKVGQK